MALRGTPGFASRPLPMALGLKGFAAVVEKGMKIALYLLIGAAGLFSTCQSAQPDYSEWVKEENYLNRCYAFKD